MAIKLNHLVHTATLLVVLAFVLASCATTDSSEDTGFDFSSADINDFDGYWEGRLDCQYNNGFKPSAWVRISSGKGEFGFGKGAAGQGHTLGSITSNFDLQNGKISWRGRLLPWYQTDQKRGVSFRGQWQEKVFQLDGRIGPDSCSGAMRRLFF